MYCTFSLLSKPIAYYKNLLTAGSRDVAEHNVVDLTDIISYIEGLTFLFVYHCPVWMDEQAR